jgi:hypothetical protein
VEGISGGLLGDCEQDYEGVVHIVPNLPLDIFSTNRV